MVARHRSWWRCSGGKSPGPAGAREVSQAVEALALEAAAPLGDGVGVATEFGSDLVVGRLVGLTAAEEESCAEGQRLGCGVSEGKAAELLGVGGGEADAGCFAGHRALSVCGDRGIDSVVGEDNPRQEATQALRRTRPFMLNRWFCETQD